MKKLILCVMMIFLSGLPTFALTPSANLAIIENSLFGYENAKETQDKRLEKIEERVYGSVQKNTLENRLTKINADLGINLSNYEAETLADNTLNMDKNTKYPIVDKMETKLYQKSFQGENIYKRLDRLEGKVFGAKSNAPLNSRVDRLAGAVRIENTTDFNNIAEKPDYEYFSEEDNLEVAAPKQMQKNFGGQQVPEIQQPLPQGFNYTLNSLETKTFGKTYSQDTEDQRIARLEKKLLKKNFLNEDNESRLARLAAVAEANKTAGVYNANKWEKALSTGVQIGGLLLMVLAILI